MFDWIKMEKSFDEDFVLHESSVNDLNQNNSYYFYMMNITALCYLDEDSYFKHASVKFYHDKSSDQFIHPSNYESICSNIIKKMNDYPEIVNLLDDKPTIYGYGQQGANYIDIRLIFKDGTSLEDLLAIGLQITEDNRIK